MLDAFTQLIETID